MKFLKLIIRKRDRNLNTGVIKNGNSFHRQPHTFKSVLPECIRVGRMAIVNCIL